jgi:LacI family transcriptional regulator
VGPAPRRAGAADHRAVEVVFDADLNPYAAEILQGVLDAAAQAGTTVGVGLRGVAHASAGRPTTWARGLAAAGRSALIAVTSELTSAHLAALSKARVPLVVIDPLNLPRAHVVSVGSTNFAGGVAATEHLLTLGHRRIGYLGGPETAACDQARRHGYLAAMAAVGAPVPPDHVRSGRFRYGDGVVGGAALLDLAEPPTAIFAGSDEVALGVVEAARLRGVRIPDDLSLVGFDDTRLARMASPPLTTVRQPLRQMGGVALRTALRLAAGERLDSHHVELATELVVRESTAAMPAAADMGRAPRRR